MYVCSADSFRQVGPVIRADPALEGPEGYTIGWLFNRKYFNPIILYR